MNSWWLLVSLAMFLIGVTKSGFGGGIGIMIVPMTAIAMEHIPDRGSEEALGLMLPLLVLGDLIAVYQYRRVFSLEIVKHIFPGTALGVVLGSLLLWWFHRQSGLVGALILMEIGIECILLVGIHWWCAFRGIRPRLLPEPLRSHLTGAFAGASSTLAHAAGPIITMYLLPLRLDRRLFVGTNAIYFFALNTAKLPGYYLAGQFERAELPFTLRFLPLVILGALAGLWLNRRMSDRIFSKVVYAITFVLGWYVLADGAAHLLDHLRG